MKVFLIRPKLGVNASGEYNPDTKELIVFTGSIVSESISYSEKFRGASSIAKSREKYVVDQVVTENIIFKSSSTAANFITGKSTNGLRAWKDKQGHPLKSLY